jgi:hypothetical protein
MLRRALRRRPPNMTQAEFAKQTLHWSGRSMRRALNEERRIPLHVVATLRRMEADLKRGVVRRPRA